MDLGLAIMRLGNRRRDLIGLHLHSYPERALLVSTDYDHAPAVIGAEGVGKTARNGVLEKRVEGVVS